MPFNDLRAVERAIDSHTAAVMVEPIQGEGGVNIPDDGYLPGLRKLCDEAGVLLVLDEIQTGMGRTGRLWGYEHSGIEPDIMTLAKALANGVPIGATLATESVASAFTPGTHGSTFGGNPFVTAVGLTVFTTMMEERLPERAGRHRPPAARAARGGARAPAQGRDRGAGPGPPGRHGPGAAGRRRDLGLPRAGPARAERGRQHPAARAAAGGGRGLGAARGRDHRPGPGRLRAVKHFLSIRDLAREDLPRLFALMAELKARTKARDRSTPLPGRTMALIFEKPSLRTRVTFEVAMVQLGGAAVYLAAQEIGMGKRESVPDVARNLSRWVDVVAARVFSHRTLEQLAANASIPVINGLSDLEHPCQAMADFFTLWERGMDLAKLRLAWVGDGNNVCNSLLLVGVDAGHHRGGGHPARLRAGRGGCWRPAGRWAGACGSPPRPARRSRTPTWSTPTPGSAWGRRAIASSGSRRSSATRSTTGSCGFAPGDALVMHCLPAHRGEEITDAVLDGPRSLILEQAENRLHAQKAIILNLLGGDQS